MPTPRIAPSLICMDHCNLERDIRLLESAGCDTLHVDILDGQFSPSLPMGLDTVRQLRARTGMFFDAHVMAMQNDFFIEQLLGIGVGRLSFQVETERHVSRKLSLLKNAGVGAGVALSPATPPDCLEYALEQCDFVLLMMINPGFASFGGESRYPFMLRKIEQLRAMIEKRGLDTEIELDGRIRLEDMQTLRRAGADTFVLGTASLFVEGVELADSFRSILEHVRGL